MNENKQVVPTTFDGAEFVGSIVENLTFVLGMFLMFSKTVDLMTAFAPNAFMGYVGVEGYYGLACGLLIEGALIVMKFLLPHSKNVLQWLWNALLILTPFLISAFAQPIDSMIVRDTLSQQPAEIQVFATWFVPSIPTIIIGLFIFKTIISSMPAELMPKGMPSFGASQRQPSTITFPNSLFGLLNNKNKNGHNHEEGTVKENFTKPPRS